MGDGIAGREGTARLADGTTLRTIRWSPADRPWAAILLIHGIAEHAGRYRHVGAALAAAGIDVHAYDHRGFGRSAGARAYVERWSILNDDLQAQLADARSASPGIPLALYGHSLGGLIATGYLLAEPARPLPDLAVLSAPALSADLPAWKRALAMRMSGILPRVAMANGLPKGGLSRDPAVEARYLADPLNVLKSTTRFAAEAFREQDRVHARLTGGATLPVPAYVFHGSADPIVPLSASALLVGHGDVTRRVFDGLRHETHNEPEWEEVVAAIVEWLRLRTRTVAPEGMVAGGV